MKCQHTAAPALRLLTTLDMAQRMDAEPALLDHFQLTRRRAARFVDLATPATVRLIRPSPLCLKTTEARSALKVTIAQLALMNLKSAPLALSTQKKASHRLSTVSCANPALSRTNGDKKVAKCAASLPTPEKAWTFASALEATEHTRLRMPRAAARVASTTSTRTSSQREM